MTRTLSYILLLFVLTAVGTACNDESYTGGGAGQNPERTVSLTLKLPGGAQTASSGQTRAMTPAEEEQIDHIHLLAFVQDGGTGQFLYTYRATAKSIASLGGVLECKVDLKQYGTPQVFVILANSGAYIKTNVPGGIHYDDELHDALPKLMAAHTGEWEARPNGTGIVRPIPMYAKTPAILLDGQTTQIGSSAFDLIRMLARIDILVKYGVSNFRLANAVIFNRKNCGRISYTDANWNAADKKVTAADVPTAAEGLVTTKLPSVIYQAFGAPPAITRSIYTFEAEGIDNRLNARNATAIVVGGYYNYPANTTRITYYRIDIPEFETDGTERLDTYGDILRNYLYTIRIKSVAAEGARTAEDAFDEVLRLTADIVPWNLADMDDVQFNGIYGLKTAPTTFIARKAGATGLKLDVYTDYDEGWKGFLVPATAASWIQFAPGTVLEGAADTPKTISFSVLANTTGEIGRHAVLRIRAGGIAKNVDIFQADDITGDIFNWVESDIEADRGDLYGPYRMGVSRSSYSLYKNALTGIPLMLSTDWPEGWTTTVSEPWVTVTAGGTHSSAGSATLLFNVTENATHASRSAVIAIQAGDMIKNVFVTQSNVANANGALEILPWKDSEHETALNGLYHLILGRSHCRYDGGGGTKSRTLKVTATGGDNWQATTNVGWITLTTATGAANGSTTDLKFKVAPYGAGADRTGIITVTVGNMNKKIQIVQYAGEAITFENVQSFYALNDQVVQTFTIKSKAAWVASMQSDANGIIQQLRTASGESNPAGEPFTFTMHTKTEAGPLYATLRISPVEDEFDPYTVLLTGKQ